MACRNRNAPTIFKSDAAQPLLDTLTVEASHRCEHDAPTLLIQRIDPEKSGGFSPLTLTVETGRTSIARPDRLGRLEGIIDEDARRRSDTFTHAHIIGQTAAKAVAAQKVEPVVAGLLVGAQRSGEALREWPYFDLVKALQLLAALSKRSIGLDTVSLGEQLVEEAHMVVREAQTLPLLLAERKEVAVAFGPLFGDRAQRAISQFDVAITPLQGALQLFDWQGLFTKTHHSLHIEPVETGVDVEAHGWSATVDPCEGQGLLPKDSKATTG